MRNNKGQFTKGSDVGIKFRFTSETSKGNQHAKGNPPNRTSFDGSKTMEKHPSWKGGIQKTKRDGAMICYAPNKRMRLARYNWTKVYGEIPKGYVIIHLDGDKYNDDVSNLEAITRAENIQRNKKY